MSSILELPIEIWESVIDNVADQGYDYTGWETESKGDLRSCSLVCRSWVPRSRIHLFAVILLQTESGPSKFAETLRENPKLGELVKELDIDIRGALERATAENQHWIPRIPHLLAGKLPNLSVFRCLGLHLSHLPNNFNNLFRVAFPSIRQVALRETAYTHPDQMLRFVSQATPHVMKLHMSDLYSSNVLRFAPDTRPYRPPLAHLLHVDIRDFTSWIAFTRMLFLYMPSATRLQSVLIKDYRGPVLTFNRHASERVSFLRSLVTFLSQCRDTLLELSLRLMHIPASVLLAHLNLRELVHVTQWDLAIHVTRRDDMTSFAKLLSGISSPVAAMTLDLWLDWNYISGEVDDDWVPLDSALSHAKFDETLFHYITIWTRRLTTEYDRMAREDKLKRLPILNRRTWMDEDSTGSGGFHKG
ncbi:hypothetical protein EIP91_002028 [Steccherinum ochraceum]|uniref:F-box domain-containing protein n=1 Tax=Steccherinum ochraceum TaxID=92696 RepID=A0A4R0RGL9_9APHY|nr:hypothetical protein EIP91_002028 [Steccherinum ochraceum]